MISIVGGVSGTGLDAGPGRVVSKPVGWTGSHTFFVITYRVVSEIAEGTESYAGHRGGIFVGLIRASAVLETSSGSLIGIVAIRAASNLNTFAKEVILEIVIRTATHTALRGGVNVVEGSGCIGTNSEALSVVRIGVIWTH